MQTVQLDAVDTAWFDAVAIEVAQLYAEHRPFASTLEADELSQHIRLMLGDRTVSVDCAKAVAGRGERSPREAARAAYLELIQLMRAM
jgi:hypothetical protein